MVLRKNITIFLILKISYSFTVTYPKKCKDVCVGIGFANVLGKSDEKGSIENKYWKGINNPTEKQVIIKRERRQCHI